MIAIEGISRDITQRRQDEEELAARVRQLEKHNHEMVILNEMGEALQACKKWPKAYPIITTHLNRLFPNLCGVVYLLDPNNQQLDLAIAWGGAGIPVESFITNQCQALNHCKPLLMGDPESGQKKSQGSIFCEADLHCKHKNSSNSLTHFCVPLMAQGSSLGLLTLIQPQTPNGEQGFLSPTDQQLAMTVAEHIALALSNMRLTESLRQQAIRDPLTDLFNRRYMEEMLERELARAVRKNTSLGIIFIDIDHFKRFNDQYGHDVGDRVLRELSHFLRSRIRKEDIVCRYGGEEFILIMPEVTVDTICQRAEEIRLEGKKISIELVDQKNVQAVTLSLGVSVFPNNGQTIEALLRAADVALYQAKKAGRDCYVLAEPNLPQS
jgi:diguanylate cyclase (GGDEF)-like protein